MSKAQKIESQNKPDILHLLDYCRIDRAAELLGCEVCDLLHLDKIGSINLYWSFKYQPATTNWHEPVDTESQTDNKNIYASVIYPVEENGKTIYCEDPQTNTGMQFDVPVLLDGLWDAGDRLAPNFMNSMEPSGQFLCMAETDVGQIIAALPPEWKEPPEEELCIIRDDIARLREAIATGEQIKPMQGTNNRLDWAARQIDYHNQQKGRLTNKQCTTMLLALQLAGFTDDDFKGGPTSLKNKILDKAAELGIENARTKAFRGYTSESIKAWTERGSG